jgi:N-methylhydantoinase B
VYVLKCLIDPDIPVNDGFYRLIDIESRPGSVVHAQHPAAVAAGWEIAMQLCDLLFRALAPALPDRVVAGTKGCVCNIAFGGMNPTSGEYFTYYETIAGGYGATLSTDGMDAVQSHFQNTENAPIEETEPLSGAHPAHELIERWARHRGLGVRRDYVPGLRAELRILGGARAAPGSAGRLEDHLQLAPGDVVSVQTPGGGGTGSPLERPAEGVELDVALGKISADRARAVYGVVVDPATLALDAAATAAERSGRA